MVDVDVDGYCHFFLADSQSKSVGLVWGLEATSVLSLHLSNEPGELLRWLCHDDSTMNIILVIINAAAAAAAAVQVWSLHSVADSIKRCQQYNCHNWRVCSSQRLQASRHYTASVRSAPLCKPTTSVLRTNSLYIIVLHWNITIY